MHECVKFSKKNKIEKSHKIHRTNEGMRMYTRKVHANHACVFSCSRVFLVLVCLFVCSFVGFHGARLFRLNYDMQFYFKLV